MDTSIYIRKKAVDYAGHLYLSQEDKKENTYIPYENVRDELDYPKTCLYCGGTFYKKSNQTLDVFNSRKFCNTKCKSSYASKVREEKRKEKEYKRLGKYG
jgi:hypothetical protein